MTDMHREAFERWAESNFLDIHWQVPIPPMINKWHYSDNRTMQLYMAWCAAMRYRDEQEKQMPLVKYQPCGCVICTCEDEVQCHGCGARMCGTVPHPEYVQEQEKQA